MKSNSVVSQPSTSLPTISAHTSVLLSISFNKHFKKKVIIGLFYCIPKEFTIISSGCVLVHCQQGQSRSASLVLAYLITHTDMDLITAVKHVKTHRNIRPNEGFIRQLVKLQNELHNTWNTWQHVYYGKCNKLINNREYNVHNCYIITQIRHRADWKRASCYWRGGASISTIPIWRTPNTKP